MGSFVYIPIIALFCYTIMMLAFAAAKKTRLINSFLMLRGSLILWSGGSVRWGRWRWPGRKGW